MNYCSNCGAPVAQRIPEGDNRLRYVCAACDTVHYQNPKIVAGCIPDYGGRILLCRRAIEPRYGLWTLPAGFMENDETAVEAAERETLEEANARVDDLQLYTVLNIPHVNQVYLMFRSRLLDLDFTPGAESLDVRLFEPDALPWQDLAFPTVRETLRFYLEDARTGGFPLHFGDIVRTETHAGYVPRRTRRG